MERSLRSLAPSLVVALGVAVGAFVALLGFVDLRARGDAALQLRSAALASALAERFVRTLPEARPEALTRAAERSGVELLLLDAYGRVVADASRGAPEGEALSALIARGRGETETNAGRAQFAAAPIPTEELTLLAFVPSGALPFEAWSLLGKVSTLTVLLVAVAGFLAYAFARDVHSDVAFVRGRIAEMAHEAGNPSGRLVPVRDADSVGVLTAALNQLVDRFTAAEHAYRQDLTGALAFDRDRTAFLAALSHELRTPLNAILGFADVLLTEVDGPLTDDARESITVLRKSAEHLRGLIDDILDLSALESGELRLDLALVDVFEIASEVARQARVAAAEKKLTLNLTGNPVTAWVDQRRVRQMLDNLVGNAVKFTEKGGVSIDVGSDADSVILTVSDTGPGIPRGEQAAIFDEYWQAPTAMKAGTGAGLGLAITRRLVRMHGGSIALDAKSEAGARFVVKLPLQSRAVPMTRFISTAPPPPGELASKAGRS